LEGSFKGQDVEEGECRWTYKKEFIPLLLLSAEYKLLRHIHFVLWNNIP